jgi:hypothetical protein
MTGSSSQNTLPLRSVTELPAPVILSAWLLPAGVMVQFAVAGFSLLDGDDLWEAHCGIGFLLFIPALTLLFGSLFSKSVRPLRLVSALLTADLALQIALMAAGKVLSSTVLQALHPANAGILLVLATIALVRVLRTYHPVPNGEG